MNTYTVVIATDQHEGDEFAAWLNEQGHTATVGNTTHTTVDGEENDEVADKLWSDYCKAF